MPSVQLGQVVEVDGLPYLVLGKTKTEYDVGTKVLMECEELTIDPASSTVEIKGIEVIGQDNGRAVDSLVSLLPDREGKKSRHSRSRCMRCKVPPVIDIHWANSHARAWFCQKCFRPWIEEIKAGEFRDPGIIRAWHLQDGEAPKKFGGKGTTQLRKLGSNIPAGAIADRLDEIIATTWMRGEKAGKGRWRTLKDGRHVRITAARASVIRGGISGKQADALWEQIETWTWKGERKIVARIALEMAEEAGEDLYLLHDGGKGDKVVSVMAVSQPRSGNYGLPRDERYREVAALATAKKGFGRRAMRQLAEDCARENLGIVLVSSSTATGFYRRLGMRAIGGFRIFHWTPEDVRERVGYKATLEAAEPRNGVFVDPRQESKDTKDYSGVIVALVPHLPITTRLTQAAKGAVPATDLHITLAHIGKTHQLTHDRQAIEDILSEIASVTPPIRYKIGGHGRFLALSDNVNETFKRPLDIVYASVDSPQLPDLHTKLTQALEAAGIDISSDHGFTPHITLAYTSDKEWTPDLKPMYGVADRLVLFWGDEQKGFNLRGSVGYVRKRQQKRKAIPSTSVDTKKGRWITLHGKPIFIAKGRGTPSDASIEETKTLAKWLQGRGMVLSGMLEGSKAKGRWRTLKNGRRVYVTGSHTGGTSWRELSGMGLTKQDRFFQDWSADRLLGTARELQGMSPEKDDMGFSERDTWARAMYRQADLRLPYLPDEEAYQRGKPEDAEQAAEWAEWDMLSQVRSLAQTARKRN